MKIAIIGTGLAGYGAYLALKNFPNNLDITFFNHGKSISNHESKYSKLPNPTFPAKKEFGVSFSKVTIKKSTKSIRISNTTGGLSDFWSCSAFPFSDQDLRSRSLEELEGVYLELSEILQMAGCNNDPLDLIFKNPFIYKEKIFTAPHLQCLHSLSQQIPDSNFKFTVGDNRILLSSNQLSKCTLCGDCFQGCPEEYLMRPSKEIRNVEVANKSIHQIKKIEGEWVLYDEEKKAVGVYDYIFLGLGVYETIKLLLRSNIIDPNHITLYDSNAIFFPVYFKSNKSKSYTNTFGYANKVISVQDSISLEINGHVLITPFNHFFTYSLFGKTLGEGLKTLLLQRVALATFYSNEVLANHYKLNDEGGLSIKINNSSKTKNILIKLISEVNSRHGDFKFINLTKQFDSSSHYTSDLLIKKSTLYATSEIENNLFIIDGNLFPGPPPAYPGSLNILAGAYAVLRDFIKKVK